ncbi:MAG: glycosyltransferase [Fibrobacterales bacterium]
MSIISPLAENQPLTILWLSGYYYPEALRALGHKVIALITPARKPGCSDDLPVDLYGDPATVASTIQNLIKSFKPDVLVQGDDMAPTIHLGLECITLPKIWLAAASTELNWQIHYAALFSKVLCSQYRDLNLLSKFQEQVLWLPMGDIGYYLNGRKRTVSFHDRPSVVGVVGRGLESFIGQLQQELERRSLHIAVESIDILETEKAKYCINGELNGNITNTFFAIPGSGSLMFSPLFQECDQLLLAQKDFIPFSSITDIAGGIEWAELHPNEAQAIAMSGEKKVLEQHTMLVRAKSVVNQIYSLIGKFTDVSLKSKAHLAYAYQLCSQYQLPQHIIEFFTEQALELSEETKYDPEARSWSLLTQGILAFDNEEPLRAFRTLSNILDLPSDIEFQLQFYKYIVMASVQCEYTPKVSQFLNEALKKFPDYPEFITLKESIKLDELDEKLAQVPEKEESEGGQGNDDCSEDDSSSIDAPLPF